MDVALHRQAWWRRPVGLRGLLWVVALMSVLWAVIAAVAVWSFYRHWQVGVDLRQQAVILRLPAGLQATASVHEPVTVPLHLRPTVHLPIDQAVVASLDQPILATVKLHSELPIETTVAVRHDVPVQTQLHLRVKLKSWLPAVDVDLPVAFSIPVDWQVPVHARVPLDLDVLVSGQLQHTVQTRVVGDWVLHPRIDTPLHARVEGQTVFVLQKDVQGMPVIIERANLLLPFDLALKASP